MPTYSDFSHYCTVGPLGIPVQAVVAPGPRLQGSPSGGTTAEEMRQIGTSSRSLCLLRPLPLPFHCLKQVTWPGPIFKRVEKCDLFLWQEFWQMASVTPLHTSRSCPSVTGVPTVPLGCQFSEPSMECSYTSLPMCAQDLALVSHISALQCVCFLSSSGLSVPPLPLRGPPPISYLQHRMRPGPGEAQVQF